MVVRITVPRCSTLPCRTISHGNASCNLRLWLAIAYRPVPTRMEDRFVRSKLVNAETTVPADEIASSLAHNARSGQ